MILIEIDPSKIDKNNPTESLQDLYDAACVDGSARLRLTCPNKNCGHKGCLVISMSRYRYVPYDGQELHIKVFKFKCKECGHLTYVIPIFVIPHRHESVPDVLDYVKEEAETAKEIQDLKAELQKQKSALEAAEQKKQSDQTAVKHIKENVMPRNKLLRLLALTIEKGWNHNNQSDWCRENSLEEIALLNNAYEAVRDDKSTVREIKGTIEDLENKISEKKGDYKKLLSPSVPYKSIAGPAKKIMREAYHSIFEEFLKTKTLHLYELFNDWIRIVKYCTEERGVSLCQVREIKIKNESFIIVCQ